MSAPRLSVVIPTFRRVDGLQRAVANVFAQSFVSREPICLILVDNDPDGSALEVARGLAADAPAAVRVEVLHEPSPGVANARNAAMAALTTPLVAFLDDDQSAPEGWLDALMATHARHPAAVTFGPVETVLPDSVTKHVDYFNAFFARRLDAEDGPIDVFFGCGNCLLDLERLPALDPMFNPAMNETGGEDDLLFNAVEAQGGGFAWSPAAYVYEHVPESRARLGYTLQRAMAYGQGPCTLARRSDPPRYLSIAMWMAIGAGQTLVNGAMAGIAFVLRLQGRAKWYDRTVRGIGKVIWWPDFYFYGNRAKPEAPASQLGTAEA